MELVKATPITEYCDTQRLTTRQRLELFLDVCHAVQPEAGGDVERRNKANAAKTEAESK